MNFNVESTKPEFTYRHNPLVPRAFQICRYNEPTQEYRPVGEYTLLNTEEDLSLTEKKVMNLVAILNRRESLMDLGNLTKTRVLYTIVTKDFEEEPTKIIFRDYDGNGLSQENAILVLEKGVLHDDRKFI